MCKHEKRFIADYLFQHINKDVIQRGGPFCIFVVEVELTQPFYSLLVNAQPRLIHMRGEKKSEFNKTKRSHFGLYVKCGQPSR